ncbi:MAG TPA: hypothetical protein VGR50_06230 [Terriglobales bacterium]|nr:hypothetical protein [Terriglobales bacterium]
MIRKLAAGVGGVGLTFFGLSVVWFYWFGGEPSFEPLPKYAMALLAGMTIFGMALMIAGVWLVRFALCK